MATAIETSVSRLTLATCHTQLGQDWLVDQFQRKIQKILPVFEIH